MALNIDKNFKPGFVGPEPRGRSEAQKRSFVKALAAPPSDFREKLYNLRDKEEEESLIGRGKKRGFLDIDLNALPEDDYPAAKKVVKNQERRPTAVAAVASNSGVEKVGQCGSNFSGIAGEARKGRTGRRWKALLDVVEDSLREHEENHGQKDPKLENRRMSGSGESVKGWAKVTSRSGDQRDLNTSGGEGGLDLEVVAPPVVRSKSGRAVALPNKYRDSFLGEVAEFPAAAIVATKRKSRRL